MTIEKAYLKFLQQVNRNFTNDNISVDKGRFILKMNESFIKYVEWVLDKRNEDDIRYIQKLLVDDQPLQNIGEHNHHTDFKLPENYFDLSSIDVYGAKGNCGNEKFFVNEIKDENRSFHEVDEASKPSFKHRETFYFLSDDKVKIYTEDFSISKVNLSYYRYPVEVDIEGYIKEDGTPSTSINPEFDDKVVNRVISIAAKDFDIDSDGNKFNLNQQRVISKV